MGVLIQARLAVTKRNAGSKTQTAQHREQTCMPHLGSWPLGEELKEPTPVNFEVSGPAEPLS